MADWLGQPRMVIGHSERQQAEDVIVLLVLGGTRQVSAGMRELLSEQPGGAFRAGS